MKKTILKTSVAAVLLASAPIAESAVSYFNYNGFFTMLFPNGSTLSNTSITTKGVNSYQTPISGTLAFDTLTGAGVATLAPFDFFNGSSPFEVTSMKMQTIGDGLGGSGNLVIGNMLFNWDTEIGIPVSVVLDASGFFNNDLTGGGAGAVPASDGTYTEAFWGYLGLGPVPIATTEWNTTNINGCVEGSCMGNNASGGWPVVMDTATNINKFAMDDGWPAVDQGIGGSPMQDGLFSLFNPNFDITTMTYLSQDNNAQLYENCAFQPWLSNCWIIPAVPIPAAVWLFGSGLLALIGVARNKKAEV